KADRRRLQTPDRLAIVRFDLADVGIAVHLDRGIDPDAVPPEMLKVPGAVDDPIVVVVFSVNPAHHDDRAAFEKLLAFVERQNLGANLFDPEGGIAVARNRPRADRTVAHGSSIVRLQVPGPDRPLEQWIDAGSIEVGVAQWLGPSSPAV